MYNKNDDIYNIRFFFYENYERKFIKSSCLQAGKKHRNAFQKTDPLFLGHVTCSIIVNTHYLYYREVEYRIV